MISLSILIEYFDVGSPCGWVLHPISVHFSPPPEIYLRVPQCLVSQFTHKTGAGQMYETARRWNRKLLAHSIYLFTEAFKYHKSNEFKVYSEHTSSCSCWVYNYTSDTSGMGNIFFSAIAIILYCTVEDLPLVAFNP